MAAARSRRRARKRASRGGATLALALLAGLVALATAGVAYQLVRKPTELLALVTPSLAKTPEATWSEYGAAFRRCSTGVIRPELLAALVQVESAGDPLARTYWRWRWRWNPLELYAPASSAVGLLQLTNGTFEEASRYAIRDHRVVRAPPDAGPYFRVWPGDAIELTSARLHVAVEQLASRAAKRPARRDAQRLAAVVHLCGRERGATFARRGFRAAPGERCGDHDLARYVARVDDLARRFERLAASAGPRP